MRKRWHQTDMATASLRLYSGMILCMGMFALVQNRPPFVKLIYCRV